MKQPAGFGAIGVGIVSIFLLLSGVLAVSVLSDSNANPMIKISTNKGDISIEMYPDKAPQSVSNFIEYTNAGFYDGLIFHRVISGFMIQGGGFVADMTQRATRAPIQNEADNGLKNLAGTLSMARTSAPHSATGQFFINLVDNAFLDHTAKNSQGWGYAVFAKVTAGMDVVASIGAVATGKVAGYGDVPLEPVIITKAAVIAE